MGNPKKFIACILALTMAAAPMAAGCGKKPRSNPKVEADSDWYNITKVTLESAVDLSSTEYSQTEIVGKVGDCYVVWYRGQYPIPYDVDWEHIDYKEYSLMQIEAYDSNGERVSSVDLFDAVSSSGLLEEAVEEMSATAPAEEEQEEAAEETEEAEEEPVEPMYDIWDPEVRGDVLVVPIEVYGGPDLGTVGYDLCIDPANGEVSYERSEGSEGVLPPNANGIINTVKLGNYFIQEFMAYDAFGIGYSILRITDGDNVTLIDLEEEFPDEVVSAIVGYLDMGSGKILCAVVGANLFAPNEYYVIDTVSHTITKAGEEEYTWLQKTDVSLCSYFEGTGNVIMDTHGVQKIDLENNEITPLLDFSCCNINRSDVTCMNLISYTEDEAVLMGSVYLAESGSNSVQFIKLQKADSNPNAGKTILTAAATGSITYAMSEAVCIFNETDPDYFITFDPKYELDQYLDLSDADDMSNNDYMINTDNAYAQLSDLLMVDIIAGEGPDIIFDSCGLSQLNTDAYLMDMSDRINTDGLFGNIIEACKTDGKLYQMPLAFGVTGIVTKTENVAPGRTGFTYEEYEEFVSTVCNGNDPLAMNQTEFFIRCLASMDDLCYTEDGKIDYDNDAFRALAEFTDENIFPVEERTYEDVMFLDNAGGIYFENGSCLGVMGTLRSQMNSVSFLGLPSYDGRGPLASVGCSVAISSQSPDKDGCWNFVETLLSQPVQEYYAYDSGYSPVNEAAFDSIVEDFITDYNANLDMYETSYSPADLAMMHIDTTRIDMTVVDGFKEMIGAISGVESDDVAIDIIIREEMPAYFFGQKTLDEVIPILENRVQTFLDERG